MSPGPAISKAAHVCPAGTHTDTRTQHMPKYTRGWPHWSTQTDAHTNSTDGLILFPSLIDQDEGPLVGNNIYTHVYKVDPPAAGLVFAATVPGLQSPQLLTCGRMSRCCTEPFTHHHIRCGALSNCGSHAQPQNPLSLWQLAWTLAPPAASTFGGLTLRDAHTPGPQGTSPTCQLVHLDLC